LRGSALLAQAFESWPLAIAALNLSLQEFHTAHTRLSLDKDAPEDRAVQPPTAGKVVAVPYVGGLHHDYVRLAA
jgi:hypothetical protein